MKYTNHHNLPDEIIRAIENDQYDKGDSVISITGLLQPPRIRLLNKTHEEELVEDYSDQIWKILGQSVHTILERANENYEDTITEERYFAQVMGWKISGQTDSFSMEDRTLKDYKITSVWTIISASKGGKSDWEQQLNSYAYLHYRVHGESIEALQIIAINKDILGDDKQIKNAHQNLLRVLASIDSIDDLRGDTKDSDAKRKKVASDLKKAVDPLKNDFLSKLYGVYPND